MVGARLLSAEAEFWWQNIMPGRIHKLRENVSESWRKREMPGKVRGSNLVSYHVQSLYPSLSAVA